MFGAAQDLGALKSGGWPRGRRLLGAELAPFMPKPLVAFDERYSLDYDFAAELRQDPRVLGNLPVIVKAYAWSRSMGPKVVAEASTCRCSAIHMERGPLAIRGITRSH